VVDGRGNGPSPVPPMRRRWTRSGLAWRDSAAVIPVTPASSSRYSKKKECARCRRNQKYQGSNWAR